MADVTIPFSDSPQELAAQLLAFDLKVLRRHNDTLSTKVQPSPVREGPFASIIADANYHTLRQKLKGFGTVYDDHKLPPEDITSAALIESVEKPFMALQGALRLIAAKGLLPEKAAQGINGKALANALPLIDKMQVYVDDRLHHFRERLEFFRSFNEHTLRDGDINELNRLAEALRLDFEPQEFFNPAEIEKLMTSLKAYLDNDPHIIAAIQKESEILEQEIKPRLRKLGALLGISMKEDLLLPDIAAKARHILDIKLGATETVSTFLEQAKGWDYPDALSTYTMRLLNRTPGNPEEQAAIINSLPPVKMAIASIASNLTRVAEGKEVRNAARFTHALEFSENYLDILAERCERADPEKAQILRETVKPKLQEWLLALSHTLFEHTQKGYRLFR